MFLEHFEDRRAEPARVLLLYGPTVAEVENLRAELSALADERSASELRIDRMPGFSGVDGCTLVACVGEADLGVEQDSPRGSSFRCVLGPAGWRRVVDLLEPFLAPEYGSGGFQYLTEVGDIEWILSTSRSW